MELKTMRDQDTSLEQPTAPKIRRRPIPTLTAKKHRKGHAGIIARNFSSGDDFLRLDQGQVLFLKVQLSPDANEAQVVLSSNIRGEWAEHEFQKAGDTEYSLSLPCDRPGSFQFKVKYSLNQGRTWYLDNVPHSSVMVDPTGLESLRLYTLIPTLLGPINRWCAELHRIRKLGFNAIHLLPVTAMDASESPYSAADLFELDPSFANPADDRPLLEQFETFVQEARSLGIRLCFDIVLNHVGVTSRISTLSADWIASDTHESDGLKRAGCWHGDEWISWQDLVLIKYDHPDKSIRREIWEYMTDYLLFWANYADQTGGLIRLDNLHSTQRDFLQFALERLRSEYPNIRVFAELFTDPQTAQKMVFYHGLNLLLATPWITPYADQFRLEITRLHKNSKMRYLFPVNSHDSGTPAQEYGAPEAVVPRYASCALLGTGQTGMVMGAEMGAPQKLPFIGRRAPIDLTATTWGHDFSDSIRKINGLLESHDVFSEAGNLKFVDGGHGALLGAIRTSRVSGKRFLILISFDTHDAHDIHLDLADTLPADTPGRLRTCFNSRNEAQDAVFTFNLSNGFRLEPCEVRVYEILPP